MTKEKAFGENHKTYDIIGIILSTLCGVHCLVTPLLIMYYPKVGEGAQSALFHLFMIIFLAWTFYRSVITHYKLHGSKITLAMGLIGFAILLSTSAVEVFAHGHEHGHEALHNQEHHEEELMLYFTVLGSLLLISSYVLNIRKCRCLSGDGLCSEKA